MEPDVPLARFSVGLFDLQDRIQQYCDNFKTGDIDIRHTVDIVGPQNFPLIALEGIREPVIYVDGGVAHRRGQMGLAVGDGDSKKTDLPGELDITLPAVKDYSDFAFVLRSLPDHVQTVRTFGFMGGRMDHQLINFGEAHHFLRLRTRTTLSFDFEVVGFSPGVWKPRVEGTFSLINFEPCELRVEGLCDYQIKEPLKLQPVTSRGLSNIGHGQIEIECSSPVFLLAERRIHMDF